MHMKLLILTPQRVEALGCQLAEILLMREPIAIKPFWVSIVALFAMAALLSARADDAAHLVPSPGLIPPSFFGMHIHHGGKETPWPAPPVAAWRLWDASVGWPQIEPRPKQWHFELLDRYLSLAKEHNTEVLLPLGLSPQWASVRPLEKSVYQPGSAAQPKEMQDWRDYVTTVVAHCKGRVGAYEIWNEPNEKGFWTGDTPTLLALTREASEIIHSIDPEAYVVSPAPTTNSGVEWLVAFLRGGGGHYVDVIGYHFYVAPQTPEAMVPLSQKVRQVMADTGVGDKPLWNTESGWAQPKPFPSEELAAAYLSRAYILNWAANIRRFYWYAWDNHSWVSLETTKMDNKTLTPAGRAYGIVQRWLVGAEMNGCDEDANQTWTCQLTRHGAQEWIIWNVAGTRAFTVPEAWHADGVTPLLGEHRAFAGSDFEIGPVPELVTGSVR
jgi:hypothetical protein